MSELRRVDLSSFTTRSLFLCPRARSNKSRKSIRASSARPRVCVRKLNRKWDWGPEPLARVSPCVPSSPPSPARREGAIIGIAALPLLPRNNLLQRRHMPREGAEAGCFGGHRRLWLLPQERLLHRHITGLASVSICAPRLPSVASVSLFRRANSSPAVAGNAFSAAMIFSRSGWWMMSSSSAIRSAASRGRR